ncbi:hypothetical protein [Planctobacterium marinum]|uniref:Uncharacterized protein n=1 Tax=Planctobacterium marinum TaxID=1631968 RepID=A0AA48HXR7_9ALTE|nr:hypothetical protein MACH26_20710 [Planctobacterium marinum]
MRYGEQRLGRNPVRLIGVNAPFQPALQFGREYAANDDPRLRASQSWGGANMEGRNSSGNAIQEPLPTRQQTALAHQLTPQMQNILRGGLRPIENKGRGTQVKPAELDSVHLGEAIGSSEKRASTVAVAASPNGPSGLRRVVGEV